jgi:hypothetical protein
MNSSTSSLSNTNPILTVKQKQEGWIPLSITLTSSSETRYIFYCEEQEGFWREEREAKEEIKKIASTAGRIFVDCNQNRIGPFMTVQSKEIDGERKYIPVATLLEGGPEGYRVELKPVFFNPLHQIVGGYNSFREASVVSCFAHRKKNQLQVEIISSIKSLF